MIPKFLRCFYCVENTDAASLSWPVVRQMRTYQDKEWERHIREERNDYRKNYNKKTKYIYAYCNSYQGLICEKYLGKQYEAFGFVWYEWAWMFNWVDLWNWEMKRLISVGVDIDSRLKRIGMEDDLKG